jgi:hypothetical protein
MSGVSAWLEEVIIPVPQTVEFEQSVSVEVKKAIEGRAELREQISHFLSVLESAFISESVAASVATACAWRPDPNAYEGRPTFLGGRRKPIAFACYAGGIKGDILIPKYYDPTVIMYLESLSDSCDLLSIDELINEGLVVLKTGDEIGRLAYGTGSIPFVRTSDLASYELKTDPKHGINDVVWGQFETKPKKFSPGLCYTLLNLPIVRQQMRNKQFTRDVIDTLGHRIREVVLPVPKDPKVRSVVGKFVYDACEKRVRLRAELAQRCKTLFGLLTNDDGEAR